MQNKARLDKEFMVFYSTPTLMAFIGVTIA